MRAGAGRSARGPLIARLPAARPSFDSWLMALVHTVPNMLFLTSYSVLIYTWAMLYCMARGMRTTRIRTAIIGLNVAVRAGNRARGGACGP